jgi:GntR family transcriptional regulator, transcriptional repressor for pyruvate dehydrogenase complex
MPQALKPIKPKRIADQVFDQLHELILRGTFKPSEKIMTERELSEAFQVSRTSIRDAINKLVVMGMLEQRQGQGTFVSRPGGKTHAYIAKVMDSQNATMQDLLEVRMGLECNSAALAAQRAQVQDIEFLEKSLIEINAAVKKGHLGSDSDTQFHMAIAYATHNPLQIFMMKQFHDFLSYAIQENLVTLSQELGEFEIIHQQHTKIINAIKAHDAMNAYMAAKQHIDYVIHTNTENENCVNGI